MSISRTLTSCRVCIRSPIHFTSTSHPFTRCTMTAAGTNCLNESLSAEVGDWLNRNWSYSTAFYHSESVFSMKLASLIQEVTSLKNENGGKFQLTSYPTGVGKDLRVAHDCW